MTAAPRDSRPTFSPRWPILPAVFAALACVGVSPAGATKGYDPWPLWTAGVQLRGANIYQRLVYPELDGPDRLGPGPVGPPVLQEDLDELSRLGANLLVLSHPGLFTEKPPYQLDPAIQDNLDRLLDMALAADLFVVIAFRTGPGRSAFTFFHDEAGTWFDSSYLNDEVWREQAAQDAWAAMWRYTAGRYADHPAVVGYDLMVEPNCNDVWFHTWDPAAFHDQVAGTTYDWNRMFPSLIDAIREVDQQTPILVSAASYSHVDWLPWLAVDSDPRVVYMVHQYEPGQYTHQDPPLDRVYPGTWDADYDGLPELVNIDWLDDLMAPIDAYRQQHGVPVGIGELGLKRWEPGADAFLTDELDLVEARGLNWAIWSWDPSWPPWNTSSDDFNFRHGPDPTVHVDTPNPLADVVVIAWSRNRLRPSTVMAPIEAPVDPGWGGVVLLGGLGCLLVCRSGRDEGALSG